MHERISNTRKLWFNFHYFIKAIYFLSSEYATNDKSMIIKGFNLYCSPTGRTQKMPFLSNFFWLQIPSGKDNIVHWKPNTELCFETYKRELGKARKFSFFLSIVSTNMTTLASYNTFIFSTFKLVQMLLLCKLVILTINILCFTFWVLM